MAPKALLTGNALLARAKEIGVIVDSENVVTIPGKGTVAMPVSEYELQNRVLEAEQHPREHRLWLLAFVSAIASVVSAAAAWLAVFLKE